MDGNWIKYGLEIGFKEELGCVIVHQKATLYSMLTQLTCA